MLKVKLKKTDEKRLTFKGFLCRDSLIVGLILSCFLFSNSLFSADLSAMGQSQRTVTGRIVDKNNEPLVGVTIVIKGANSGTISDVDGNYSLPVDSNNDILVFSYIGYQKKEMKVGSQSRVNVILDEDTELLDEVVVVGYGTMKKRDLSGAIAQVKASELLNGNPASSINQALQGKLAGVIVSQNDGAPGGGINIQVRGVNSFGTNSQPLYIVDGVPFDAGSAPSSADNTDGSLEPTSNALSHINPHDIESIEVLKDASATAIYGSRGANGVVIITTKQGREGKPKVEFTTNFSTSNVAKRIDMMDAYTYATFINEQTDNDNYYYGIPFTGYQFSGEWFYKRENGTNQILDATYRPKPEDYKNPGWYEDGQGNKVWVEGTDWQDRIFQRGWSQEYNLSVSGGTKSNWYSFSGNYLNQEGTIKNSGYKRFTIRSNAGQKLFNDRVELGLNMHYSNTTNDFAKTNSVSNSILRSALLYPPNIYYGDNTQAEDLMWLSANPYTYVMSAKNQLNSSNLFASAYLEIQILKSLKFRQNIGYSNYNNERNYYYNRETGEGAAGIVNGAGGWSGNRGSHFTTESMLTFNKTFGKIHNLNIVAANTIEMSKYNDYSFSARQFPTDLIENYDIASALINDDPNTYKSGSRLHSVLGRVNYVLLDRYIFTASFRSDGSSKFAIGNQYATFASGAVAWRLSEERFIKSLGVFDNLKLRLSFGQTGNQAIGDYQTLYLATVANYPLNSNEQSGYKSLQAYNPDITWETTDQYNAGIDFGFLNNRLSFTAEYYYKKTTDLLQYIKIPASTGYSAKTTNFGFVTNEGLEFTASFQALEKTALKWHIDANLSFNRNRIGGLEADQFATRLWNSADRVFIQRNGYPIGAMFGYVEDGFYDNEAEVRMDPVYTNADNDVVQSMIGEIKYRNFDDDPNITTADMQIIGNTNPDYVFGITNSFNWKFINLSFFIQGVMGNNIFNGNLMSVSLVSNGNAPMDAWNTRWTRENYENAKWPKATAQMTRTMLISDRYVEDGSYIRLKNVNLGFTFRNPFGIKAISLLNIYLSGSNLLTLSKYSWYDPDVNAFGGDPARRGVDIFSYPSSRTYSVGLKVDF